MIAHALDDGRGAAVADREAVARCAGDEHAAAGVSYEGPGNVCPDPTYGVADPDMVRLQADLRSVRSVRLQPDFFRVVRLPQNIATIDVAPHEERLEGEPRPRRDAVASLQQIGAPDEIVETREAELRKDRPDFVREQPQKADQHVRRAGEAEAQIVALCRDASR